jgi:hypothetical protein
LTKSEWGPVIFTGPFSYPIAESEAVGVPLGERLCSGGGGHGDLPHFISRSPRPRSCHRWRSGRQAGGTVPDPGAHSKYPFERSPCPVPRVLRSHLYRASTHGARAQHEVRALAVPPPTSSGGEKGPCDGAARVQERVGKWVGGHPRRFSDFWGLFHAAIVSYATILANFSLTPLRRVSYIQSASDSVPFTPHKAS